MTMSNWHIVETEMCVTQVAGGLRGVLSVCALLKCPISRNLMTNGVVGLVLGWVTTFTIAATTHRQQHMRTSMRLFHRNKEKRNLKFCYSNVLNRLILFFPQKYRITTCFAPNWHLMVPSHSPIAIAAELNGKAKFAKDFHQGDVNNLTISKSQSNNNKEEVENIKYICVSPANYPNRL